MNSYVLTLVILLSSQCCFAGELNAHKIEELEKMFVLKNLPQSVEAISDQLMGVFDELSASTTISEKDKAVLKNEIFVLVKKEFEWNNVKEPLLQLYSDIFSLEEIKQINVFYSSPSGRRWIAMSPVIDQQLEALTNQRMNIILPKVEALAQKYSDELDRYTNKQPN